LAVECTGSYVLSLGGCAVNSAEYRGNHRGDDISRDERLPVLTLKLYGEYNISRLFLGQTHHKIQNCHFAQIC
jgi:hypothetical protein